MEIVSAHIVSTILLVGGSLAVPFLAFATYYFSGVRLKKAFGIAFGVAVWGVLTYLFMLYWQAGIKSPLALWGIIITNFILPSLLVLKFKDFFVGKGLSLEWLTVVQAFRFMGALFIIEYFLGHTGSAFAFTAGFGDVMAAVIALTLLLQMLTGDRPSKFIFYFLIIFGTIDFIAAYSLSFLSTSGTGFQLLSISAPHLMSLYPLALLPFFMVPFAMAYHTMMYLTLKQNQDN